MINKSVRSKTPSSNECRIFMSTKERRGYSNNNDDGERKRERNKEEKRKDEERRRKKKHPKISGCTRANVRKIKRGNWWGWSREMKIWASSSCSLLFLPSNSQRCPWKDKHSRITRLYPSFHRNSRKVHHYVQPETSCRRYLCKESRSCVCMQGWKGG